MNLTGNPRKIGILAARGPSSGLSGGACWSAKLTAGPARADRTLGRFVPAGREMS